MLNLYKKKCKSLSIMSIEINAQWVYNIVTTKKKRKKREDKENENQ